MEFRPCIDIHNGSVKQIIGGSLKDEQDFATENFVSSQDATFYSNLYFANGLKGGHIIMLNPSTSDYYEQTKSQAINALNTNQNFMQIGGGITLENAKEFLEAGASHVIITSYIFHDGILDYSRLKQLEEKIGKERIVLDLSCKKIKQEYFIVTDRWQMITNEKITYELLDRLSEFCNEFLIHAVDVEGKANGIEKDLVTMLGKWGKIPITYAGGVHNFYDLELLKQLGQDKINVTIGSALDLFGGSMKWEAVIEFMNKV